MMEQILRDLLQTINNMQWSDYLDIVVVALLIYKLLPLVRTPHTMRLARTVAYSTTMLLTAIRGR